MIILPTRRVFGDVCCHRESQDGYFCIVGEHVSSVSLVRMLLNGDVKRLSSSSARPVAEYRSSHWPLVRVSQPLQLSMNSLEPLLVSRSGAVSGAY